MPSQAASTNTQGDSIVPPQAGSSQVENADSQSAPPPKQSALTPREIALFPLWQVAHRRRPLIHRHSVPLPKQFLHRWVVPRQAARARVNNPQGPSRGNALEDPQLKWINLSSKTLTQAQRSVLAKGPNFLVSPRHPPNLEYITAIESVCTKLGQQDAE